MKTITRNFFARQIIAYQLMAFILIIALIWLDEFADIPSLLLGGKATPVNWRESLIASLLVSPIGLGIICYTKMLFNRMQYLEGLLPLCSYCKKIKDEQENWQQMESYIHDRSAARFSHGICPTCAKKFHPEVFDQCVASEEISRVIIDDSQAKRSQANS